MWHTALLIGLGDPENGPDHRPGGQTCDAGSGGGGRRRHFSPGTLQRDGQLLPQRVQGAEEELQEGDRGGDKDGGQ